MASFKCSECSLATKRSYNLRRHLRDVHGICANTPVNGDNKLQAGLPSRMSEEKQYGGETHRRKARMEPDYSEEEDEPRINPVDGLYSREEIEKFGEDLTRKKMSHIRLCVGYISRASDG